MTASGENEPCHSLRRHGRSTSISGPAGAGGLHFRVGPHPDIHRLLAARPEGHRLPGDVPNPADLPDCRRLVSGADFGIWRNIVQHRSASETWGQDTGAKALQKTLHGFPLSAESSNP